jgi:hypothetical protein
MLSANRQARHRQYMEATPLRFEGREFSRSCVRREASCRLSVVRGRDDAGQNYREARKLYRRLNLLLYLNRIWKEQWGANDTRAYGASGATGVTPWKLMSLAFENNAAVECG